MSQEVAGKVNGHGQAEQSQAIIAASTLTVDPYAGETAEQLLARAQQQIALHQGIVKLIAANIHPKAIQIFGENIWLRDEACLRVLGWIGANISLDKPVKETHYESTEGPYIDFEAWGDITLKNGRTVRAMGSRSTLDDFFAKENIYLCPTCHEQTGFRNGGGYCAKCNKAVRGEKQECYKPLTEVDIPSVKKAAVTNLFNHAIKTLGLMPSKEELLDAGMKLGDAGGRVDFKKDKKAPPEKEASPKGAAATAPSTPQTAAAPAPKENNGVPKSNLPKGDTKTSAPATNQSLPVGKGIVSEIVSKKTKPKKDAKTGQLKGGGTPFLEVIQNGHSLYCFKNHETETMEGPEKVFDMILAAKGQFCDFTIETKDGERPLHSIVGALRIGRHEWDSTGQPVRMMDSNGYQAEDEDIPF